MSKIYTFNDKIVTINNKWCEEYVEPTPPGPSDEVTIGTQKWKNVNLAVDDGQSGVYTVNDSDYGLQYYYTQSAANRIVSNIDGWHIPTYQEWQTLFNFIGGKGKALLAKLASTSGWSNLNATNDYGFNLLPLGYYSSSSINYKGSQAALWLPSDNQGYRFNSTSSVDRESVGLWSYFSESIQVRLIKDT